MLTLRDKKPGEIIIDQTHEEFAGTDYAGSEFTITAQALTPSEEEAIRRGHIKIKRGAEILDNAAFLFARFNRQVTDWTGIRFPGMADGESAPCTTDNKKLVFNSNFGFVNSVLMAIQAESERVSENEDSDTKN